MRLQKFWGINAKNKENQDIKMFKTLHSQAKRWAT